MKKCWKVVSLIVLIVILSCLMLSFMNFIKDSYLQNSFAQSDNNDDAAEKDVNLRFAWWGANSRHEATLNALQLFEEKHPHITVTPQYQDYDGFHAKMAVQMSTSEAPDILQYNPENLGALVSREQIVPLEHFVQEGILDISNIPESNLLDGKYNGKLYGIPMSIQTFCMVYNKHLFDIANVPYPKDAWTWQDYENTLLQLKKGLPEDIFPSADMRAADMVTMLMVHQQGGFYLNNEGKFGFQEQIKLPLTLFQNYSELGLIPTPAQTGGMAVDSLLVQENVAIIASYTAMAQALQSKAINEHQYGLVAIPSSTNEDKLGTYVKGELLFVINSASKHQKEAAMLLNSFLNDSEIIEILGVSRGLSPSSKAQAQLEKKANGIEKDIFRLQRLAEQSKDVPEFRFVDGWSDCIKAIEEITLQYAYSMITVDEAVLAMENSFEKIISDYKR